MTLIGVQLYTVRDQLDDVGRLFAQLAEVGVEAVEPFGLGNPATEPAVRIERAREIAAAASDAGLSILSTHTYLPPADDTAAFVEEMHELGVTYTHAAIPDSLHGFERETFDSAYRIRQFAEALNTLADVLGPEGFTLGYHNHFWEWPELPNGTLGYDLFWRLVGRKVTAEVDLLWATFAGQDAVEIVRRLRERIHFLHVGDAAPIKNTDFQLPAGAGDSPLTAALAVAGDLDAVYIEATTPPPGTTALDLVARSVEWLRPALADRRAVAAEVQA